MSGSTHVISVCSVICLQTCHKLEIISQQNKRLEARSQSVEKTNEIIEVASEFY
ncbi:hypothetical protein ACU8KH_04066 [Lachancea thermotolerans]